MHFRSACFLCLVLLTNGLSAAESALSQKYNVLFIISDDLTATALSCYGNKVCRTPNIDRLAARGTRFTRAYCQGTFCGPSRASFMSGYYPHATGILNYVSPRNAIGNRATWAGHFKNAGYYTARVSKIFHMGVPGGIEKGGDEADDPISWTERFNSQGPEWKAPGQGETLEGNPDGKKPVVGGNTFVVVEAEGDDLVHSDGKTAKKACELIDRHKNEPFFLGVGFVRPHVPFVAPKADYKPYPFDQMELPEKVPGDWDDIPKAGINYKTSKNMKMDLRKQKKALGGYYASVSFMDRQVGKVLDALKTAGLDEKTIVIFTSDHGYHLGEHDFWAKVSLHEESAKVPLIISVPGKQPAVCDSLVELLDLFPTISKLCGLEVPSRIQGKDISQTLDDPNHQVRKAAFSVNGRGFLLREDKWAYIQYGEDAAKGRELFNMESDPLQYTNLADDPDHQELVARFQKQLADKLKAVRTNDLMAQNRLSLGESAPNSATGNQASALSRNERRPSGDDWPQFRGPNSSGISTGKKPLPVKFSEKENVQWSAELGDSIGSPVVAAGRVFTSAMIDEETVGLYAFDAATGAKLWERTWKTGKLPEVHQTNSHASTSPAADAERVYFYFSTLGLIAVDAQTGKDAWHKKLPTPFFVFKWGPGMSPVLYKDLVLFCQDDDLHPAFYALDKKTGDIRWKDERNDQAVNYSHPVICKTKTGDEIIVAGTGSLIGYDPETGKRLWKANTLLRNIKTTPVVIEDVIYISLQSGGIANQWLATADRSKTGNNDGKLSKEEMQAFVGEQKIPEEFYRRTFDRGDINKNGLLEGRELDLAFLDPENFAGAAFDDENPADEFILAVKAGGRGDVTKTHVLWKHETKYTDHIVSPLVSDGRMFLLKGGGITTVYETATGKSLRKVERIPNTSNYFASPIVGDGKIYVAGENGVVVVLKDSPDYEVLAENDLGDDILGTPAIAGGRLFIRTRSKLICVGN